MVADTDTATAFIDQRKLQSIARQLKSRLQALESAIVTSPSLLAATQSYSTAINRHDSRVSSNSSSKNSSSNDIFTHADKSSSTISRSALFRLPSRHRHSQIQFKTTMRSRRNNTTTTTTDTNPKTLVSNGSQHSTLSLADPIRRHVAAFHDCFDEFMRRTWPLVLCSQDVWSGDNPIVTRRSADISTDKSDTRYADISTDKPDTGSAYLPHIVDSCDTSSVELNSSSSAQSVLSLGTLAALAVGRSLAANASLQPSHIYTPDLPLSVPDHYSQTVLFQLLFDQAIPSSPAVRDIIIPKMIIICEDHCALDQAFYLLKHLWLHGSGLDSTYPPKLTQEHVWAWRTACRLNKRRAWERVMAKRVVAISMSKVSNRRYRHRTTKHPYKRSENSQTIWMITQMDIASGLRVVSHLVSEFEIQDASTAFTIRPHNNIPIPNTTTNTSSLHSDTDSCDDEDDQSNSDGCIGSFTPEASPFAFDLLRLSATWLIHLVNTPKRAYKDTDVYTINRLICRYMCIVCAHMDSIISNLQTADGVDTYFAILVAGMHSGFLDTLSCNGVTFPDTDTTTNDTLVRAIQLVDAMLPNVDVSALLKNGLLEACAIWSRCSQYGFDSGITPEATALANRNNEAIHCLRNEIECTQDSSSGEVAKEIEKWRFEPLLDAYILSTPHAATEISRKESSFTVVHSHSSHGDSDSDTSCVEYFGGGTPIPRRCVLASPLARMSDVAKCHDPLTAPTTIERSMRAYIERRKSRQLTLEAAEDICSDTSESSLISEVDRPSPQRQTTISLVHNSDTPCRAKSLYHLKQPHLDIGLDTDSDTDPFDEVTKGNSREPIYIDTDTEDALVTHPLITNDEEYHLQSPCVRTRHRCKRPRREFSPPRHMDLCLDDMDDLVQ
ncbi:hypothetical protein BSLG_008024 [Batrachochytrium salamandrivorans]|nr:hypothetical protein BSLG_008024 [Batrachochytrium salamandrivorans]